MKKLLLSVVLVSTFGLSGCMGFFDFYINFGCDYMGDGETVTTECGAAGTPDLVRP